MRGAAIALVWVACAGAQEVTTLRTETRVVQIDVVVKDSRGRSVGDLAKEDFTLFDRGKARAIQIFSVNRGEDEPGTVRAAPALPPNVVSNKVVAGSARVHATAILLDCINDYFDNYGGSRDQVIRLIGRLPGDERVAVYVLSQNQGLVVLQDYTTDHELLIRHLKAYVPSGMIAAPVGRASTSDQDGLMRHAEAVQRAYFMRNGAEAARTAMQAIAQHMAIVPGRKSLLWVSQGFPPRLIRDSPDPWAKTIEAMNQANVELDAVDSNGLDGAPRRWGPSGLASLQELAARTGGRAAYNRNDLHAAMEEMIGEKRTTYTLAFYLADDERDGRFHPVTVRVNRPHVELHHRQGYMAGPDRKAVKKAELELALLSPLELTGVGITMTAEAGAGTLRLHTVLDAATVSLTEKGGRWEGTIDELFVEVGDDGTALAKVSHSLLIHLNAAEHERFVREGLAYSQALPLKAGTAKVRAVVRDAATGNSGSVTMVLQK